MCVFPSNNLILINSYDQDSYLNSIGSQENSRNKFVRRKKFRTNYYKVLVIYKFVNRFMNL